MSRPTKDAEFRVGPGGYYYVYFHNPITNKSDRQSLFTKDFEKAAVGFLAWKARNSQGSAEGKEYLINDLIELYQEEQLKQEEKVTYNRGTAKCIQVLKAFGHLRLGELTPTAVKDWSRERMKSVSRGTARTELAVMIAALNYNASVERITYVPKIPLPRKSDPRSRVLEADEITALIDGAMFHRQSGIYRPETSRYSTSRLSRLERFIAIALRAPARKVSIERLTWDRVSLERRMIDFREPGKALTSKQQVEVPISSHLLPVLRRAKEEAINGWVLDCPGDLWHQFNKLVKELKLPGKVTPHTLRHTAATHLARNGFTAFQISQILGNSEETCMRVYTHRSAEQNRKTVEFEFR